MTLPDAAGPLLRAIIAAYACRLALRRTDARAVAACLVALAAIDAARMLPLPRVAAWCWLAWPVCSAALSWRVWGNRVAQRSNHAGSLPLLYRSPGPKADGLSEGDERSATSSRRFHHAPRLVAWQAVCLAFLVYASLCLLAPAGFWQRHPVEWTWARSASYVAGPLLSLVAWALRSELAPPAGPSPASHPPNGGPLLADVARPLAYGGSRYDAPASRPAQAVASILAASACLDVATGLVALPAEAWWAARIASAVTWGAVFAALVRWR